MIISAERRRRVVAALAILCAAGVGLAAPSRALAAGDEAPAEVRRAAMPEGYVEVDGIAAVVGKHIITLSALVRAQAQGATSQQMVPTSAERPRNERDALRQTLETLIDNELIADAARGLGLTVADDEIDAYLDDLRKRNVWDLAELREAVRRLGFADMAAYREHVRAEKLRVAAIRAKLGSRLRVTDEEVQKVLETDYAGGKTEEEIRSRHILVKVPAGATPYQLTELRRKAWKIHDQVKAGSKPFAEAAEEFSDDMGTQYGGDLGYMRRWMLDQTFANTLWSLQKDEISEVIQTPFGFHIVQLLDRRRVPVKDKRILEQFIRAQLTETSFVRLYKAWMLELRAATHVEIRI
jgi:peptidyl-prolyl cis-trans isomerase SurA